MSAISLNIDTDIIGDDFEKGRKLLANVLKAIPDTHGITRLEAGTYVKEFTFYVDPETVEVKCARNDSLYGRINRPTVTLTIDEL